MIDFELAELYNIETKQMKRQVKRNIERFPPDFMFVLDKDELEILRCQIGTLNVTAGRGQHRKYSPRVFTEQGVFMLSAVLKSDRAIQVCIRIMQAFVAMRKTMGQLHDVIRRLEGVEQKQWLTDTRLDGVIKALPQIKIA